jgi:Domain of unknown function (DUF4259)
MGTFGVRAFENDGALDWVWELDGSSVEILRIAFAATEADYLEAPVAEIAVAAAEVVASAMGRSVQGVPPEVTAWLAINASSLSSSYAEGAIKALDRVTGEHSELQELYEEAGDEEWQQAIAELRTRLTSI